jgi:hypothetical protein
VDHRLGRAFAVETVRREIDALTDLAAAKAACHLLLGQIEVHRQMAELLIESDWFGGPP